MTAGTEAPAIGLTHGGSEDTGLGNRGPQSKSIVVPYGFWLFVLSDMVLFSALFATYASLVTRPTADRLRASFSSAQPSRLKPSPFSSRASSAGSR